MKQIIRVEVRDLLEISVEINGSAPKKIMIEEGETLLEMIRNRLSLKGTKKGCEVGECGACTVLLDGTPITSCIYMAALADGHKITTIEGVSVNNRLSEIQKAFVDHGAIQCGFCTPGVILTTYALLKKDPHPTREVVQRALANNLCRCGSYEHIVEAVLDVADELDPKVQS